MVSTSETIEIVFIPIYFLLFLATLFSFFKHSRGKKAAFGLLFVFPLIRMVGNALLVAAVESSKKASESADTLKDLYTWGFILQLAGFGLLFSSALGLTNRAILHDDDKKRSSSQQPSMQHQRHQRRHDGAAVNVKSSLFSSPSRLLHLLNTVATILLIVGLANSTSAFDPSSADHSIATTAKAGVILTLIAMVILTLLVLYHLFVVGPVAPSARVILSFVLVACIPMLARSAFSTYRLTGAASLVSVNIWAQLVLQYICECVAVVILLALAFTLQARGGDGDLDERRDVNERAQQANAASSSAFPMQATGHHDDGFDGGNGGFDTRYGKHESDKDAHGMA